MRPKFLALVFTLAVLVAIVFVALPYWIIQPMSAQSPRGLETALWMKEHGFPIALAALLIAALVTALMWSRAGPVARPGFAFGLLLAASSVVLARINYFEMYFRPDPDPRFVAAAVAHLEPGDMVLSIHFAGQARAYPIRAMAYHHVVNDRLGGVPVVATY